MKTIKTVRAKRQEQPMIIEANRKIAIGHQQACCGTGVHKDKRDRRCRTRGEKMKRHIADWS